MPELRTAISMANWLLAGRIIRFRNYYIVTKRGFGKVVIADAGD
ncbi:MAG: hypothetical protein ACLSDJ_11985 [Butyricimonas faecihominis]